MGNLYEQTNTLLYIADLVLLENDAEKADKLSLLEKLDKLSLNFAGTSTINDYPKPVAKATETTRKNSSK